MNLEEKTLSTKTLYSGKVVTLELSEAELPNGNNALREVVRHPGGAAVLLVNDGKILLERQFRFPYNKVIWEIPAGKLEKGEDPKAAAVRELEEECGLVADDAELTYEIYPTPGYSEEHIYIYRCYGFKEGKVHLDENEFLTGEWIEEGEVRRMMADGRIRDGKTLVALLKYFLDKAEKDRR